MNITTFFKTYWPHVCLFLESGTFITVLSTVHNIPQSYLIAGHTVFAALNGLYLTLSKQTPQSLQNISFLKDAKKLTYAGKDGTQISVLTGVVYNDLQYNDGQNIYTSPVTDYNKSTGIYSTKDNVSYKVFQTSAVQSAQKQEKTV